ncbi:MAG: hypothetical protein H7331_07300 [Bacteroidia bacterium]|nr:hypothetical protein [Bacteroidia bacterium]
MKKIIFLLIVATTILISCKKKTENIIIDNNNAPNDTTVNTVLIDNYINKAYISLLGRKPSATEQGIYSMQLVNAKASIAVRTTFIQQLQTTAEYKQRLYSIARTQLLNNFDTTDIEGLRKSDSIQLQDTTKRAIWFAIQESYDNLVNLQRIPTQLANSTLNMQEMHRRCCFNVFYDGINMGTQNFVTSVFDHFMFRYPSNDELKNGIEMVDGQSRSLLFKGGKSKKDFLTIVMASNNYFEGQVRDLIKRYLYRNATTVELSTLTQQYLTSNNYQQLQLTILISNEYVGIK